MQVCRQEIVEHVRDLKNSVIRMNAHSTNGTHHNVGDENDLSDHHDLMEDGASHPNGDDEFLR